MSEKMLSAGKGALFLTALSAVSQLLGFGYRVVLSRLVGAEVMGLYQLIMPVYSVIMSLTAVGLVSATSNLTSQHLALGSRRAADQTVSTSLRLFFPLLLPVGTAVILGSDAISVYLLGDARTQLGLILLVPCVALTGVENIHKHFFYGGGYVRPPAIVELLEQFIRAAAVLGLLWLFLPQYPERTVGLIVLGMVLCEVFSAVTLAVLFRRKLVRSGGPGEARNVLRRRIAAIAVPVGLTSLLGNLMGAANATLIPRKLVEGGMGRSEAISELGVVCGMTLPMLALPTVFLGALSLVIVPRLSRAAALGQSGEVRRLASKAISAVSLLLLPAMTLLVVLGGDVGALLFRQNVGEWLLPLAAATALTGYQSTLCSILNGANKQSWVAIVTILCDAVQLLFTLLLIPRAGMGGFVAGAVLSSLLGTALTLVLVGRATGLKPRIFQWVTAPALASLLMGLNCNLLFRYLKDQGLSPLPAGMACLIFGLVLYGAALQAQGVWEKR